MKKFLDYKLQDGCTVQPQTKEELVDIIKDTCKKKGWNCDLNFIDTSKITDMSCLFSDISSFWSGYGLEKYNGDISKWNTFNVTNMRSMFDGAHFFNHPLNNWDVSNVTNMSYMFREAEKFNQPLNNWNTSKVTSMTGMFCKATSFNQPLDKWDTKRVNKYLDLTDMFKFAKNFDNKIPSLKNFEFKRFDDKCFLLGLPHKYAEKHQHDF